MAAEKAESTNIRQAATTLEHVVRDSGAVAWLGAYAGTDAYGRTTARIYLSERRKPINPKGGVINVDVVSAIDELALALEPEAVLETVAVPQKDIGTRALRARLSATGPDGLANASLLTQSVIRRIVPRSSRGG